ncbi:DUF2339 domain-containing protein [Erythrobacter mangrovi]|uniref:DUF2339 domain-containing protein n=1 Tax=Erythrobacter mangrovi TaxID=2739433 RepID=A0A7D4C5P7_9SPHN|nr:DUF2339 domain-containing protein [Erythrobacter mangrovi]QKG72085.1 DUF2339 domain-containing protein [Erythrobacter mangrovi]
MEWLFIFGLAGLVAMLWSRLDKLERRLTALDELQDVAIGQLRDLHRRGIAPPRPPEEDRPLATEPAPEVAPEPAPAPKRVTVPSVSLRRSDGESIRIEPPVPEPSAPETEPEPASAPLRERFQFDFEEIFGRRLPIWAGGVTLAVAGVFLVKYSIERGLITPLLRVIMAFVFGGGLIAGAEAAYRYRDRVADPRVAQALAGAGLATLYAGFYLAGTQYGLIGQGFAFLGLAAVTAGAIALSFRFGLPSAVLGLVGGFAAPALVGGEEANIPLLALYLGLVTGGLTFAGREQRREWMGIAALIGGLGWGAILLLAGDPGVSEIIALGLYFTVLGVLVPAFAASERFEVPIRLAAALVASVQLALLVDQGGYSMLAWGLYLLLGATLAFFGWKQPQMREGNAVAATVALLLVGMWPVQNGLEYFAVTAALTGVFALAPLVHVWRNEERTIDLLQVALVPAAMAALAYGEFGDFFADRIEVTLAAVTLALGAIPAVAAWRIWQRGKDATLAIELCVAALLAMCAIWMVSPAWLAPLAAGLVFAALFVLLRDRSELELRALVWGSAVLTALALFGLDALDIEIARLAGDPDPSLALRSMLRWAAPAAAFVVLAWHEGEKVGRQLAEGTATVFVYGALAQVLPGDALAWTAAALAGGSAFGLPDRPVARYVSIAIALLWSVDPATRWIGTGVVSLFGEPVYVDALPSLRQTALYIIPAIAGLAVLRGQAREWQGIAWRGEWLAALPALVALHIGFKQLFAIETVSAFVEQGMAERTLWESLLLAAGWILSTRFAWAGRLLIAAALAHFLLYSGLLHNPLWDRQAVGATPIANLILAAYAIAVAASLLLHGAFPDRLRPWLDGLVVTLVSFGALTLLRQAFAGNIPMEAAMTQTEDLLRSLLGILLAIGFLLLGSRRVERSWRVGSLVLMVLAVAKVFIVDAAGLEGLLRIASFMALGFSLIGIGWLYSRQLRATPTGV